MPIKDVFGPVAAGGGGGAAWAYDPAKTYIAGMGVTTQASVPGSYQVRFYSPADSEWSGEGDTAYGVVGTNNYGWQTVTNGKYVIVNTAGTPQKMAKYDPVTDAWTTLGVPPMQAFQHYNSCSDGATGVYVQEQNLKLWHWEETTDVWTALLDVPSISIPAASLAKKGAKLYLFNGSTVHEYDIAGNTWTANVAVQPSWFYVGGATGSDGTGLIYWWQNTAFKSFDGTTFATLANSPVDSLGAMNYNSPDMAVYDGKVYVPMTALGTVQYAHVAVYDIATNTWDANLVQSGQAHAKGLHVL